MHLLLWLWNTDKICCKGTKQKRMHGLLLFMQKPKADGQMHQHLCRSRTHVKELSLASSHTALVGELDGTHPVGSNWAHPSKLCVQTPSDPTTPLRGIYPMVSCTLLRWRTHKMTQYSARHGSQGWRWARCPSLGMRVAHPSKQWNTTQLGKKRGS